MQSQPAAKLIEQAGINKIFVLISNDGISKDTTEKNLIIPGLFGITIDLNESEKVSATVLGIYFFIHCYSLFMFYMDPFGVDFL